MSKPLPKTPWAVWCYDCSPNAPIYLTNAEYRSQLAKPDAPWRCPYCGGIAEWDDDIYEESCGLGGEE